MSDFTQWDTTTAAPQWPASCGHVHDWGIGCGTTSPTPFYVQNTPRLEREFGPCPKCDGSDFLIVYHDGKPHCADCRREGLPPASCKRSDECGPNGRKRAHLRVHCRRCQYGWLEKPGGVRERPR